MNEINIRRARDGGRIQRRRWTEGEDEAIRRLYATTDARVIGEQLGRTEDAVWIRATRVLGLEKRDEVAAWTDAELDELRRCYATEAPAKLAARLGRTPSSVYQQARVLGLLSRKRLITEAAVHDYFHEVTTAEQAYVLGVLAADGCVSSEHPRIVFGQQAKDAGLVEFVRDRLNPGANLSIASRDGFAVLQVTSRQMVLDLAKHGIVPRKSRILGWPSHLDSLQRPFLLGYFDGDGSMYTPKDRRGGFRAGWTVCSGSEQFLIEMRDFIYAAVGIQLQEIQHRRGADLWQVASTGRNAYLLDEWLHQDGLGLARKRLPEHVSARYRL